MRVLTSLIFVFWVGILAGYSQNESEAALLLDLKKSRADYEVALQKYGNDTKLFEEKAISANDFNQSKNALLSRQVDYQKLILKLISQQSYITVEKAIKYQDKRGNRKVKVSLKSALEGNEEYLTQFEDHFDVFTPEMRAGKIYNVYVSLVDNESQTIIGSPYEFRIPSIELGKMAEADFELLKDVEDLTVSLNYNNRKDLKNIYLRKDAGVNSIDISANQFSQEAEMGSSAVYEITLERFSTMDDVYKLEIENLPRQINYDFSDGGSKISQIKFAQGVNVKKLTLRLFLPERSDEHIVIDQPIKFEVNAIATNENVMAGNEQLEILPRGKGKLEVILSSLYYEITSGDQLEIEAVIRNRGSKRLDNISIKADKPFTWEAQITPDMIKELEPGKEETVKIIIKPPKEGGAEAQEVKIKTAVMIDNLRMETEDKTVRIHVNAATSVWGTLLLISLFIGIIGGIVWFGLKLSKK